MLGKRALFGVVFRVSAFGAVLGVSAFGARCWVLAPSARCWDRSAGRKRALGSGCYASRDRGLPGFKDGVDAVAGGVWNWNCQSVVVDAH